MTRVLGWLLPLLFLALLFSGWKTWQQADAYERETLAIIQQLEAETRLENAGKQLLEIISLGFYDDYSRQVAELARHKELQQAYRDSVHIMTGVFLSIAFLLLGLSLAVRQRWLDVAYMMLAIAFVALLVGLATPILSLQASRELPVLGETVFQFQSKGILTTIGALREQGNLWLAVILFLFSVLIPLAKTLVTALTFFSSTRPSIERAFHISHHLGKWSMADVFVVAILVAFFANSGENSLTRAEVQAGLWFFAVYVILSLLATQLISRLLGSRRQIAT
ncbi:MAG: paraquat-inducible protein A [Chromatiales bacterium]|jgi:hypothetical protein